MKKVKRSKRRGSEGTRGEGGAPAPRGAINPMMMMMMVQV